MNGLKLLINIFLATSITGLTPTTQNATIVVRAEMSLVFMPKVSVLFLSSLKEPLRIPVAKPESITWLIRKEQDICRFLWYACMYLETCNLIKLFVLKQSNLLKYYIIIVSLRGLVL